MRTIFPLLACLLLSGAAASTLVATHARAQTERRAPMMVLAQNTPTDATRGSDEADRAARFKARCESRYAAAVGRMAYLETRLNLTAPQQASFAAWLSVRLGIAKRDADACAQRDFSQERGDISPVERMSRMEDRLKQRVADLDTERPAFAALYATLTPDQRKALMPDRHFMMGRRGMMERGMMRPGAMNGRPNAPVQR